MSYLPYLCLLAHSGVQHILCCVLFCLSLSLCTIFACFSGLSIFDCPFGILFDRWRSVEGEIQITATT